MTGLITKGFIAGDFFFQKTHAKIVRFTRNENGATAVEYALIVGLITVLIFAAVKLLGGSISDQITKATCAVQGKGYNTNSLTGAITCA